MTRSNAFFGWMLVSLVALMAFGACFMQAPTISNESAAPVAADSIGMETLYEALVESALPETMGIDVDWQRLEQFRGAV